MSTLPFVELWDEDKEKEVISLPMDAKEKIITGDPSLIIEAIFGDLNLEGHQVRIASPNAIKGERVEPKAVAINEDIEDGRQKGAYQAREERSPQEQWTIDDSYIEGLPGKHFTTPGEVDPLPVRIQPKELCSVTLTQ